LLVLLLAVAVPLKHVRSASNLLMLCGSVFIAAQTLMIFRPAANPVPIASPLADEWLVGQGGHAELVNYHHVTSTQRDALDILQARDGRTHQPGNTELTSYYIYGKPVLAPADGTVTFVQDGRPDQRIGSTDSHFQSGNNIVIDIGSGRYLMMAHLSQAAFTSRSATTSALASRSRKWATQAIPRSPTSTSSSDHRYRHWGRCHHGRPRHHSYAAHVPAGVH
jgi:hypothetical protein